MLCKYATIGEGEFMSEKRPQQDELYRFRVQVIVKFIISMLMGHRRDLASDIAETLLTVRPQPRIVDDHHIPYEGPFAFITNHYERPGLKVFWGGMLTSKAVFQRRGPHRGLRWLMTSEWYSFRLGFIPIPTWFLRWLFRRVARVYDLVVVPRASERLIGRAAAMRSILQVVGQERGAIALFPEGVGKGNLTEPQSGTGTLLLLLSQRGIPILPAGLYEQDNILTAKFGPPFHIQTSQSVDRNERDLMAKKQIMIAIGRLLPRSLWGDYTLDIEQLSSSDQKII